MKDQPLSKSVPESAVNFDASGFAEFIEDQTDSEDAPHRDSLIWEVAKQVKVEPLGLKPEDERLRKLWLLGLVCVVTGLGVLIGVPASGAMSPEGNGWFVGTLLGASAILAAGSNLALSNLKDGGVKRLMRFAFGLEQFVIWLFAAMAAASVGFAVFVVIGVLTGPIVYSAWIMLPTGALLASWPIAGSAGGMGVMLRLQSKSFRWRIAGLWYTIEAGKWFALGATAALSIASVAGGILVEALLVTLAFSVTARYLILWDRLRECRQMLLDTVTKGMRAAVEYTENPYSVKHHSRLVKQLAKLENIATVWAHPKIRPFDQVLANTISWLASRDVDVCYSAAWPTTLRAYEEKWQSIAAQKSADINCEIARFMSELRAKIAVN